MPVGPIVPRRTAITQPDVSNTRKSQKRRALLGEYNPQLINNELDYVHERLNMIVVEDAAIEDLDSGASLGDVITRLNLITETLRSAGLLKR